LSWLASLCYKRSSSHAPPRAGFFFCGVKKMRIAKTASERSDRKSNEVKKLVREFERCRLPLSDFKHRAHLSVALFYLTQMPVSAAAHQFRAAIKRFIEHYGETGYNETITMFWLNVIVRLLITSEGGRSPADLLDELLESYGDSRLIFTYYSRERLQSDEAKAAWVAPDLKPFDL
jgi:hypothetical protein